MDYPCFTELSRLFNYEPDTGLLTWKISTGQKIKPGDIAGSLQPCRKTVYRRIQYRGRCYKAHRIAWILAYGRQPEGQIDHIDGDGLNNRLRNLRDVTSSQNNRNRSLSALNSSGVFGVHLDRRHDYWHATIYSGKKRLHLYCGKDFFEAVCRRKSAEKRFDYHRNHGRAA